MFTNRNALSANQLEFVNLVVDHLTADGAIEPARLYKSPFTGIAPKGPDGLFEPSDLDLLVEVIDAVRRTVVAACPHSRHPLNAKCVDQG